MYVQTSGYRQVKTCNQKILHNIEKIDLIVIKRLEMIKFWH